MKFSIVLALVAAATVVSAESNAQRFARGLGPNSPVKRGSPVEAARRHEPSHKPHHGGNGGQCNTGSMQCCNQTKQVGQDTDFDNFVKGICGVELQPGTTSGTNCSPIAGANSCSQQPVCCENNDVHSLVSVNCSPITIVL